MDAFNALGGDPSVAKDSASGFSSTKAWAGWQGTQAAAVGAAAMAVPFGHLPALALDVMLLMHKMAFCAWGVGHILDCEVDGKDDFGVILAMWSGDVSEDAVAAAATGGLAVGSIVYPSFAGKIAGMASVIPAKTVGGKAAAQVAGTYGSALVQKAATKLSAKIGAKLSTKATAGFIPLIGSVVGASVNSWFMFRVWENAESYYTKKRAATEAAVP